MLRSTKPFFLGVEVCIVGAPIGGSAGGRHPGLRGHGERRDCHRVPPNGGSQGQMLHPPATHRNSC